ncbi:MAG: glycosyltransferase [Chloroflexi bacterium]|nr:glycosyltransferase [Chloroflexota bacterium]
MIKTPTDLSVIIPVYQNANLVKANLPILRDYLATLPMNSEILIIDDGSKDQHDTRLVAESNGAVFLANPGNQGKGAAVRRGMLAAEGRVRLFTDADLPYKLEAIEQCYSVLEGNTFDIVVGDRTLPQSVYFELIPKVRRISSKIFLLIVRTLLVGEPFDTQCGFKGFKADIATAIFSRARINRFAMDVELLTIAHVHGYRINRLPVHLRDWDLSEINIFRDGFTMFRDLFLIRYYLASGKYE